MNQAINERKAAVNRFFTRTPTKPNLTGQYVLLALGAAGCALGLLFFIGGVVVGGDALTGVCCGILFLGGGIAAAIPGGLQYNNKMAEYRKRLAWAEPKPPVEYIRELLLQGLQWIEGNALRALGIDADDLQIEPEVQQRLRELAITAGQIPPDDMRKHPLIIVGPAKNTRIAYDSISGSLLFERCAVSVICPTESQFSVYECVLYLDTGGIGTEETLQYPYSHVAAVSTLTVPIAFPAQPMTANGMAQPHPTGPQSPAPPLEATFDVPLADMEFQFLRIQVSSGNAAEISCGLVNRQDRRTSVSSFMPDFNMVTDAVRAALRQRGVFGQPGRGSSPY